VRSVIAVVLERDGGCVGKGQLPGECWGLLTGHHIVNRGMGGSKLFGGADWRLAMCEGHNAAMESDPETARRAVELGMKVPRNGVKPERARVHYRDGWHVLDGFRRVRSA